MSPSKKVLLQHEKRLLDSGLLQDHTHRASSSTWLKAPSTTDEKLQQLSETHDTSFSSVFRHMADAELNHLLSNNEQPSTQPYQTIVEGEAGRKYCEKYLTGQKRVDTDITTIVEFTLHKSVVQQLFDRQHKIEDGVLSMGLGYKAGKGLPLFNADLQKPGCGYRIVLVKRRNKS